MASGQGNGRAAVDAERRRLLELASHEALFDALLPAQDGVFVKDRNGRYLMVNASGAAHLGYLPEQLVGKTDLEIFPGQLGERLMRSDREIMETGEAQTLEEPVVVGGQLRTYLSTKARLTDSSGAVIGLVGVSTDVSPLREADEEVRRREAQLAEAQALSAVGSWEWEIPTGELRWSEEAYRVIGRDPSQPAPTFKQFLDCVHPDDRRRLADAVATAIGPGSDGVYDIEHRIVRPDGEVRTCICRGRVFFDLDGTPLRMVGAVQDVTERKRSEAEREALIVKLETLARTDELTGLLNRRAWDEELARELARARRDDSPLCVALYDLDRFKAYNDAHGHQAGDELLRSVAYSWRDRLRQTDVLARYGGEEFAAAFPSWPLDTALQVVERLRTDMPAGQTCSAGLVTWDGEESASDLVGRADLALYQAKHRGRDRTVASP
jgi:diguanylate cyclase (GGDEF)-like protein/PAS domain S-box-containing protein